ncbi:MAG: sulfotransferase [Pseudoxanthomonas sp.]
MDPFPAAAELQRMWERGLAHAKQRQWREAAYCFCAIAEHAPGHVPAALKAADALLQLDQYREARRHALQASTHVKGYPGMLVETCQALRRFNESTRLLDVVAATGLDRYPSDSASLAELASLVSSVGDQVLARELVERALRADTVNPHAHYMRGIIAMFQGDMFAARESLEASLRLAPDFSQAYWVLSGLDRLPAAVDPARVQRLQACLSRTSPASIPEAYLCFALHNELHAAGNHELAWQALERGCTAKRALTPYDPARDTALFEQVKSLCTADFVVPVNRSDGLTPIFIVGMHRSGTTLLERILAGHSQVTDGGETYAFTSQLDLAVDHKTSGVLDLLTAKRLAGADFEAIGAGFIEALRGRSAGRSFVTEKLPPNFINLGFIAKALPNAKFLHMVRDPLDTCFSNLRTYFNRAATYSNDQVQLAGYYARYRELMRHWQAVMPGRILEVAYADLVDEPEASARRIFDYCGLPFEANALLVERQSGTVATASSAYVRKGILRDRAAAWKPYAKHLQPLQDALSQQAY